MNWGIYEWLMVGFLVLGLVQGILNHGKPQTGRHDAWAAVAAVSFMLVCLIGGGFFE